MRVVRAKLVLLGGALACIANAGCLATRPHSTRAVSYVDQVECTQPCELYDRREALRRIGSRIHPREWAPAPLKNGYYRTLAAKQELCDRTNYCWYSCTHWIHKRKEEANAPPWPKFHVVPAKPAFEGEEPNVDSPERFGTFGGED